MRIGRFFQVLTLSIIIGVSSFPLFAAQDYEEALHLTTYFYGAQRCGDEDSWIHDTCHVKDGDGTISDLTGGWHDCGDHVTFGQTAPYAAGALLEGYVNFPSRYPDRYSRTNSAPPANGIPDVLDEAKVMTDWLIKACNGTRFYYQKGNGDWDHKHMAEPHDYSLSYSVNEGGESDGSRPMSYRTSGGSNVAGDSAAALALMAIAYEPYDPAYATTCFNKAKEYFAIGNNSPNTVGGGSYYGAANWTDDMSWGAAAIYRASVFRGSPESSYLTSAISRANDGTFQQAGYWPLCYDHTEEFANYELYKLTGDTMYRTRLADEITYYKNNMASCGYAHVTSWGSLRYAGNMAFAALLYYDISNDASALTFAQDNIDFILGDHAAIPGSPGAPAGRSFIIGYTNPDNPGAGSVEHPHHRSSFGYTSAEDADGKWPAENSNPGSIPYKNTLYGALVGGPRSSCGDYNDKIDDYVANEVGVDYNAGINGALGALVSILNPATPTNTPTFTRTDTPDPSWTNTYTPTVTHTATNTPIPPPTQKLDLKIRTTSGDSQTGPMRFALQIFNNEPSDTVAVSSLKVRVYLNTSAPIFAEAYNTQVQGGSGTATFGYTVNNISTCQQAADRTANKYVELSFSGTGVLNPGGYLLYEGVIRRDTNDWNALDPEGDDYAKNEGSWSSYTDTKYFLVYQDTDLVCEYLTSSNPDPDTGIHPCTGANGCPGAVTNTETNTPVPPTQTHTNTNTSTQTPVPPTRTFTGTYTYTSTATETPIPATQTFTSTFTDTFTSTDTSTSTETPIPPTQTFTGTRTYTFTSTDTPTDTETETPVPPTETFTQTFTNSVTYSFTPTSTYTPTDTITDTPTDTITDTPTNTITDTPSDTVTNTPTDTATDTYTPTETNTPVPGVDLVVVSAEITAETLVGCVSGSQPPLGTRLTVRNEGTDPSGPFNIDLNGTDIIPVADLAGAQSYTVWVESYSMGTTVITVDSGSAVAESDEGNNTFSQTLPVPTPFANCTDTPTDTYTPTDTFTITDTPTETFTATYTITNTPVDTETDTPTQTPTDTSLNTETQTPVDTVTNTPVDTDTLTYTPTATDTSTDTITNTPSDTPTGPPPATWTYTDTPTNTSTYSPTNTYTNIADTVTHTPTGTSTNSYTATYTPTNTYTPTQTSTPALALSIVNVLPGVSLPVTVGSDTSATIYFDNTQDVVAASVTLKSILGATLAGPKFFSGLSIPQGTGNSLIVPLNNASTGFDLAALGLADGSQMYVLELSVSSVTENVFDTRVITINNPVTITQTATGTKTPVYTETYTETPVQTSTETFTEVFTHTPTITYTPTPEESDTLEVVDLLPYPNPFNPREYDRVRLQFRITQSDVEKITIKVYSAGFRLVRSAVIEGSGVAAIMNMGYLEYSAKDLMNLANGTYYYCVIAEKGGNKVKSKVDKLIILK